MKKETPAQMPPTRTIRLVGAFALITMLLLCTAGIKVLTSKPATVKSEKIVVLQNDTILTLSNRIAALQADSVLIHRVAGDRLQIIANLTSPLREVTDSLLALQRAAQVSIDGSRAVIDADALAREDRYGSIMGELGKMKSAQPDINALLDEQTHRLARSLRGRDTIYATLPDNRSWWQRLWNKATRP